MALSAIALLSFAVAACDQGTAPPKPSGPSAPIASVTASPRSQPAPSGETSGAASASTSGTPPLPLPDPVESEKGETGARGVLLTWARGIEFGRYGEAWRQWGDGGARSGLTEAEHAAQFAPYTRITIGFGDGDVEGAAGSLYYKVPVDFTGERKAGGTVERSGTITLRRVNDVDGATAAQRKWHIDRTTLRF